LPIKLACILHLFWHLFNLKGPTRGLLDCSF